tara:strand:- start:13282 stop:13809 length:528 start_codon:yes stop_codon:yes gene_type:complete
MGSKPKQQDYKPSETEKVQAAIAKADQEYFQQTYNPLIIQMRDQAQSRDTQNILRGRAQADTMQTLTSDLNIGNVRSIDSAANLAGGAISNMLNANVEAGKVKTKESTNVLGIARGQQADAGSGLARASKLARSEGLTRAAATASKGRAITQALANFATPAAKNYGESGGLFYSK